MNEPSGWSTNEIETVRAKASAVGVSDKDICELLDGYSRKGLDNPVAFAISGANGKLARDLRGISTKRRKAEVGQIIDDLKKTGPKCDHGDIAAMHPETGLPLCPMCRREQGKTGPRTGAEEPSSETDPGQRAAIVASESPDARDDQKDEFFLPAAPVFPHEKACGPLRDLLDWAAVDGLPVSYVAAAAEVAAAGAAAHGPGAELRLTGARIVRPVLWQVLIGDSGDGKNPAIRHATAPAERHYADLLTGWRARCQEDGITHPRPQALAQSSISIEAAARWLDATDGAGILRNGELASLLRGLGQYKRGGGSDRFDLMDMWSGEPISVERVGQGGKRNSIFIYVPVPRVSIIGGLVPENLKLLGSESDGLRARFLPVLPSSRVISRMDGGKDIPASFRDAIKRLYECQEKREWALGTEAHALIVKAVERWHNRKNSSADPVTVRTTLAKADEQCLRIALTVSELAESGKDDREIPAWAVVYAIARVDYAVDCWLALGSDQTMAFSRKDEVINAAVADLLRLIERQTAGPDGRKSMSRRDIQRSNVGGATTPYLVDALIFAYLRAYPHTVTVFSEGDLAKFPAALLETRTSGRGPAPVIVYAPRRGKQ
jgi:hypothetical protein